MNSIFRRARFAIMEPYRYECPRCKERMAWNPKQGPFGGWYCVRCGLQIDHKPGY